MNRLPAVVSVLCALMFASVVAGQATQPAARGGRAARGGGAAAPSRVDPTPEQLAQINGKLAELKSAVAALKQDGFDDALIAESEVSAHYVGLTLRFPEEFFDQQAINRCISALDAGLTRAKQIRDKAPAWTTAVGSISRAFRSKVDGTPQPYRVVLPANYSRSTPTPLYVYLHGRGDTDLGLGWLGSQGRPAYDAPPADAAAPIQLQVFGRANNSFRYAGETDVFEAIEAVRRNYRIDPDRIVLRGFSMGAAGVYQIGLRNPSMFVALEANAGVLGNRRNMEGLSPSQKAAAATYGIMIDHAQNIANVPFVGFAGENDAQLASSTAIRETLSSLGYTIDQIDPLMWKARGIAAQFQINPGAGHAHARDGSPTRNAIDAFLGGHVGRGRVIPDRVQFVTYTTRYGHSHWVSVDGLVHHFERATVDASRNSSKSAYVIKTSNVSRLGLLEEIQATTQFEMDGQVLSLQRGGSPIFEKAGGEWRIAASSTGLRKRAALQGPINDAFFDSFLCVSPSGAAMNPAVAGYSSGELDRFTRSFAKEYRGEARTKADSAVTDADIAGNNLILFGDPSSNAVLARIADRLPIRWTRDGITVGAKTYSTADHLPVMIYPNPLNPSRYVVINAGLSGGGGLGGGFGDWAILKIGTGATETVEGGVFDEAWKLPAN